MIGSQQKPSGSESGRITVFIVYYEQSGHSRFRADVFLDSLKQRRMDFLFNESTQRCSMYSSQIKQWIPCGLPTTTASSLVITQPVN
ncbi:hypothetical protein Tcan_10934 [Toxocara canis]|uniref:Uncharacterized protein n=1 Tax=Toxocara canis TaxID=6265 RepID=A0A0B2V6X9_TOXCA|nr:hypothetical protein Tcan_10934 [Toxocara canis]